MKIIATKGLPGSGKSTWARAYQNEQPIGEVAIINNDSIQQALFGVSYVANYEMDVGKMLKDIRYKLMLELWRANVHTVIIDNTNLSKSAREEVLWLVLEFANGEDDSFEWKDFTDVPIWLCLERNEQRENPVPESVIYKMVTLL